MYNKCIQYRHYEPKKYVVKHKVLTLNRFKQVWTMDRWMDRKKLQLLPQEGKNNKYCRGHPRDKEGKIPRKTPAGHVSLQISGV